MWTKWMLVWGLFKFSFQCVRLSLKRDFFFWVSNVCTTTFVRALQLFFKLHNPAFSKSVKNQVCALLWPLTKGMRDGSTPSVWIHPIHQLELVDGHLITTIVLSHDTLNSAWVALSNRGRRPMWRGVPILYRDLTWESRNHWISASDETG